MGSYLFDDCLGFCFVVVVKLKVLFHVSVAFHFCYTLNNMLSAMKYLILLFVIYHSHYTLEEIMFYYWD